LEDELNIQVSIADRLYPIKVNTTDRPLVESAARRINAMITEYSERYAFKDKQDLLAMAALQYSTHLEKLEISRKEDEKHYLEDLLYLDKLLSA